MLSARLYGVSIFEAEKRIDGLCEDLDLKGRENQKVSTLSGGLKRRFSLIRALLHQPDIIISY